MKTFRKKVLTALMMLWGGAGFAQAPINDDCINALNLTLGNECTLEDYTTVGASAEPTSVAPNPSCGLYQGGDVWFKFTVPSDGYFRIAMNSVGSNQQWALYVGSCGDFSQLTCATAVTQLSQNLHLPDLANETLYLRAWRFNSANGGPFTLCVSQITPPANNQCSAATPITVGSTCEPQTYTSVNATASVDIAPNPSCGLYIGADVWFSFVVPASGNFRMQMSSTGSNAQWAL